MMGVGWGTMEVCPWAMAPKLDPRVSIREEEIHKAWVKLARASWKPRNREKSKFINLKSHNPYSIERDAQLLANRIALLKQEEMRTWKKIEETKKRATEVVTLKQKNEYKMNQKMEQMRM